MDMVTQSDYLAGMKIEKDCSSLSQGQGDVLSRKLSLTRETLSYILNEHLLIFLYTFRDEYREGQSRTVQKLREQSLRTR